MMRFFTADTHFGHDNARGGITGMMGRTASSGQRFACCQEHDAYLMNNLNYTVGREDELYILGDFAWTKPGRYRTSIRCKTVRLIVGNHDKRGKCANVFGDIRDTMVVKLEGPYSERAFISHYPHAFWDGSHRGWIHLYGHHHRMREQTLDDWMPERRAMDVGVDNIKHLYGEYRPISEVEILEYMAKRAGHDHVSWYDRWRENNIQVP